MRIAPILLILSTPALAQEVLLEISNPAASGFGRSVAFVGDVTDDGVPELLVGSDGEGAFLYQGTNGGLIRSFPNNTGNTYFGVYVAALGDVTGDGLAEVAIGSRGIGGPAITHVHSAVDGTLIHDIPVAGFGLARIADLDGDGFPELGITDEDYAYVYSGATGTLLHGPAPGSVVRLNRIADAGDVDGDGKTDIVTGNWSWFNKPPGEVLVRSGADFTVLPGHSHQGSHDGDLFGFRVAGGGDVDGDTVPDILATTAGAPPHYARLISGAGGALIREFPTDGLEGAGFLGDLDADGLDDFVLGGWENSDPNKPGVIRLYSGASGAILAQHQGNVADDGLGREVSTTHDLDGDGCRDVLAGTSWVTSSMSYVQVVSFASPSCPWHHSPVNGNWYRLLAPQSWVDAEAQAQSWGGHLTTIRSQAENDWLLSTFVTDDDLPWIGYTDQDVEGTFEWTSGEPVVYENWRAGQPDDDLGADWAIMAPPTGTWLDEPILPERPGILEVISDDCDGDGAPDAYEIALDPSLDWNGDGVLDECSSPNYCQAASNSTGVPAVIGASGSPVAAENDLTLEAWDLPQDEFAYFLTSQSTAFVPGFGGSSGNLCLGPPIVRFNRSGEVLKSDSTGTVSLTLDLTDLPQGIAFQPGDVWYFQLWFRDWVSGPTSNTTDGIEVLFR